MTKHTVGDEMEFFLSENLKHKTKSSNFIHTASQYYKHYRSFIWHWREKWI